MGHNMFAHCFIITCFVQCLCFWAHSHYSVAYHGAFNHRAVVLRPSTWWHDGITTLWFSPIICWLKSVKLDSKAQCSECDWAHLITWAFTLLVVNFSGQQTPIVEVFTFYTGIYFTFSYCYVAPCIWCLNRCRKLLWTVRKNHSAVHWITVAHSSSSMTWHMVSKYLQDTFTLGLTRNVEW